LIGSIWRTNGDARRQARLFVGLAAGWLVTAATTAVHADGGTPCWSGRAGNYQLAAFQSPTPPRVGTVEFTLIVQDAVTSELLADAPATLRFAPRAQPAQLRSVEFSRQASSNPLFQSALVHVSQAGWWEFTLEIGDSSKPATASFSVQVAEAPPRWLTFWPWFSWPAVAVAIFGFHQWLVVRSTARRA